MMTSRDRLETIIAGGIPDRCGFWLGDPHPDTWPIYFEYFGTTSEEEIRLKLNDDFRWIMGGDYVSPIGNPMFFVDKIAHGTGGPFVNTQNIKELDDYEWPELEYLNFTNPINQLKNTGPYYRASGFWTCFYHNVMDLFGMESYLINMHLNPELVHAVTDRVCEFYYEANERYFEKAGDLIDGFFFGNDFGTQLDLICSPKQFDEFVMPWFRKFTEQAHRFGYQVILHSCGSIYKVIDRLIEAEVECLHPLQAKAANMDAETLAKSFKGKIAFLGGIDTQDLLVSGTPQQIKTDVRRVKELLGPNLIVSPSHEALLPNVPPQNVVAMAEAAVEM
jgi:uroporphyrinogen decarboxylase